MKNEDVLKALKICRSAVDSAGIYPVFSHFCFTPDRVYGYNDVCAVLTPLESGIHCALRGTVLLGVLETMRDEVEFVQTEETVQVKSGRSKTDLAALPPESFMFEEPEPDWQQKFSLDDADAFFTGLQRCVQTVGDDSQMKAFTGVTLVFDKTLTLYSSDDIRLSRFDASECCTAADKKVKGRWLVPGRACLLLLEAWQAAKATGDAEVVSELYLSEEWLLLNASNVLVYSKLLPDTPPDFPATLRKIVPKDAAWQPLPLELRDTLKRAEVLVGKDPLAGMLLSVNKKMVRAKLSETKGVRFGDLDDSIALRDAQESIALTVGIVKLSSSLNDAKEISFNADCIGLRTDAYTCWVAPLSDDVGEGEGSEE